jgi:hypothetical protein
MPSLTLSKTDMLHELARDYVLKGLGGKNFDAIPYAENVALRAPICPGGSAIPLVGKENLRSIWWAPLPTLVGDVRVIDSFVNSDNTAVTVEFHCDIIDPFCTLRVVDRFTVNEQGQIIAQENFLDPRDITNPGWKG